jgi:cytochrome bd-type quinol oxidase subunit 2
MERFPNILNAASNLLGICFLIITGLSLTRANSRSYADETAWASAVCFLISIALSYYGIRSERASSGLAAWADRVFMLGVLILTASILIVGFALA